MLKLNAIHAKGRQKTDETTAECGNLSAASMITDNQIRQTFFRTSVHSVWAWEIIIGHIMCSGLVSKWQICCLCFSRCAAETPEDAVYGEITKKGRFEHIRCVYSDGKKPKCWFHHTVKPSCSCLSLQQTFWQTISEMSLTADFFAAIL